MGYSEYPLQKRTFYSLFLDAAQLPKATTSKICGISNIERFDIQLPITFSNLRLTVSYL